MQCWQCGTRKWDVEKRGLIMGVVNVTPDSFSDGGSFLDPETAIAHGRRLMEEGADLLDVGGESTRPGAEPVSAEEELRRVMPVVRGLVREGFPVSIDTAKASVAWTALEHGACVVNDVTGLRGDPGMLGVIRHSECGLVLMHSQGRPKEMQLDPRYRDVVEEVRGFLAEQVEKALAAGIAPERLVVDPGIGFGKTLEHNLELLRNVGSFRVSDRPVLIGVSRKSFIAKIIPNATQEDRDWATVALTSCLREKGARIFRVHAVRPNREALRMTEAILETK